MSVSGSTEIILMPEAIVDEIETVRERGAISEVIGERLLWSDPTESRYRVTSRTGLKV